MNTRKTNQRMTQIQNDFIDVFSGLLESARTRISDIKPSQWVEENRMMTPDVSPLPGMFSYKNSPYTREIIDCLAPDNPARQIAVMKGAQIGFSTGVIEGGIGWIVSNNPGNILFLVGHEDLVKDAMTKVDRMLDNTSIESKSDKKVRSLIRSSSNRSRNTKTGDTDSIKEFPSGYMKLGSANHKVLRNISMQFGFIDDFESMKQDSKQSGSTLDLINQRFAAYAKKKKVYFISTPELEETSNIYPVYLAGDQRKYHVNCPCCNELIVIEWSVKSELNENEKGGIFWQLDENGELIESSVGYVCYKCGNFFDDSIKSDLIKSGKWIPTAKPSRPGNVSYHISSLLAPVYMYSWTDYVRQYLEANPVGGKRNEQKWKTFQNLVLGLPYKQEGKKIKATDLQLNIRPYERMTIPEKLSIADGNGKIVLITLGSDLNGKEDDARLDYEIVAWSENGATYSIDHGSIGTFVNNDKKAHLREHWTYRRGVERSVWTELDRIMETIFVTDTGRKMRIFMGGVDSGYMTNYAYDYVENSNHSLVALKGKDIDKYQNLHADLKTYRKSREHGKLFLVETNHTKDVLASHMSLKWNPDFQSSQPMNFMNFPTPSNGKYLFQNYFSHFEAEHKVIDKSGNFIWQRITAAHQNHIFDCRLYASVVRDIFLDLVFAESKIKNGTWSDFVGLIMGK